MKKKNEKITAENEFVNKKKRESTKERGKSAHFISKKQRHVLEMI